MERQIVVEELGAESVFSVNVSPANKQEYLKSYPNATGCCSRKGEHGEPDVIAKVSRKMVCSGCGAEVPTKTPWKVIGSKKDAFLFPAAKFDELEELQEKGVLKVSFVQQNPANLLEVQDRFDDLFYFSAVEEKEEQYAELCALLDGRCAVGSGVFGKKDRQFFLYVGKDNVIRCRCLVDERQHYAVAEVKLTPVDADVVELERKLIDKKQMFTFEVAAWRNKLLDARENMIETYGITGEMPMVVEQVKAEKVVDKLARLKAKLEE